MAAYLIGKKGYNISEPVDPCLQWEGQRTGTDSLRPNSPDIPSKHVISRMNQAYTR